MSGRFAGAGAADVRSTRDETSGARGSSDAYSPQQRTAVVLCGTGAHGAYHAGVLRALKEAGVRIDLMAGHGIGAGNAALAAIDGTSRLWEADGVWRAPSAAAMYAWKRPLRAGGWIAAVLVAVLLAPVLLLALGVVVLPVGFVLEMATADAGAALTAGYARLLETAFAGERLPTIVPRAALAVLLVLVGTLVTGSLIPARHRARRRARGWWWRLIGAPIDAEPARRAFSDRLWELIRGAAAPARPGDAALGRRYVEVLTENLGQPGFHELVIVATDLDARRDTVAALLGEPFRRDFVASRGGGDRRAEVIDFAGIGRDHVLDMLGAALTPSAICDPQLVAFAADSHWRGEAHRMCDRAGGVSRLLEEVAAAAVTQVLIVSATAPVAAPHRLQSPRLDPRSRLGEFQAAAEAAALRDALEAARLRFASVFLVRPSHNPIGPFDFRGVYDEASDRRQPLSELVERGYEDAYRQFIDPIVGASGDQLARAGYVSP